VTVGHTLTIGHEEQSLAISERKQREFERREQEIIEAAHELFKQGDIHAVTIEQIAEAADIGKGTVYKHFKSKDEIYCRIIIQLNRAMRTEIAAIDRSLPFRERLDRIIDTLWNHNMHDSQFLHQLTLHVMSGAFKQNLGTEMLNTLMELQEEELAFYMQLLKEAQQRGEIIDESLDDLLFSTSAAIDGAVIHYWLMEASGAVTADDSKRLMMQLQRFIYRALSCNSDKQAL
jgi:AcrR family transcriptional regulator